MKHLRPYIKAKIQVKYIYLTYICNMENKQSILKLLLSKGNLSDSEQLRRKIFLYTMAEVCLVLLLFGFSFFLFQILVG